MQTVTLPTTWQEVCNQLGIDDKIPFDVSMLPTDLQNYLISCYQSPFVTKALNGDWVPDYTDISQRKYEINWRIIADAQRPSGFALSYFNYDFWLSSSSVGVRHCFKDLPTLNHAVAHFLPVYEKMYLIIK